MKDIKEFAVASFMVFILISACPLLAHARAICLAEDEARLESGNREIMAVRPHVEVSSSGVILAGAVPDPTPSASTSSINPSRGIGGRPPQDKQADRIVHLEQLVERGGKRELRGAATDVQVLASRHDLDEVRRHFLAGDAAETEVVMLRVEALRADNDARAAWFASQFWDNQTP